MGVSRTLGEVGVALEVVGVQRLFDPDEVEFLQLAAHAQGGGAVPLLVGVHHQGHVPADVLADAGDAAQVLGGVRQADLDLDAADALVRRTAGAGLDLVQGGVEEAAGGVVGLDGVAVGAQELGQRQAGALGLEVVERDVDGGEGLGGHAGAAHGGAGPEKLGVELADVVGVLADDAFGDFLGVGVLGGPAGALGVAEADSAVALLGGDFGEEEDDLGHGLLASGEHLRVADRNGERKPGGGKLYVADEINAGHGSP